jgi:hypothetical protein
VTDQDLRDVKMVDASTGTVSYGTILPTKDGIISLTIAPDKAYAVMHTDISRHTTVGTYPAYGQILMLDQVESTSNPPLYLCAFHQSTSQSNNRSYFFCDKLTTAIKLPADALTTPLYMVRYQWANFQQKLYLVSLAVDSAADPTNNTANYRAAIFEYSYTASGNSLVPSLQSKAQVSFTGKNTVQGTVWQNLLMALIKHNPQANSSQQLVLTPEQDQLILGQVDPTYTETKLARITSKVAAISSFPQALNYFNSDLASGEGVWMAEGQWNAKSYHKANRLIATTTLRDHLAITNLNQRQSYRPQLMENAQDEDALTVLGAPIFVGDDLYFVGKMNAETSPDKPTTAKNVQLFKVRLSNLK